MAVHTSKVYSSSSNSDKNITITPDSGSNILLSTVALNGEDIVGVDNAGTVKSLKISNLPLGANIDDTDYVIIEDTSDSSKKKAVTVANFFANVAAGVFIGDLAPSVAGGQKQPAHGDLWWDSARGIMFVYYDDTSSQQWVDISPNGTVKSGALISPTPPTSPSPGDIWFNATDSRLYVYYSDANSDQWIDCSPQSGGGLDS